MKKWSLTFLLGISVAAFIAALVLLPSFVKSLKPQIELAVQQATGRAFRIRGDLDMSWFPSVGLELSATQLGNHPDFSDTPFAEVDQAILRVAMIPLLRGQIKVETLQVKGLKLNLAVDKQGRGNWQDLIDANEINNSASQQSSRQPALSLAGIEIEEAALNWHDLRTDAQLSIVPFSLTTGAVVMGQAVELELQFAVRNKVPAFGGQIHLKTRAHYEPHLEQIRFQEMALVVTDVFADGVPFTEAQGRIEGAVQIDMKNRLLYLHSMHAELRGKHLQGPQVQLDLAVKDSLKLDGQRYDINDFEIVLDAQGEPLGAQGLKATLHGGVVADLQAQTISLAPMQFDLQGQPKAGMQLDSVMTTGEGILDPSGNHLEIDDIALEVKATEDAVKFQGLRGICKTSLRGEIKPQRFTLEPLDIQLRGEPQPDMHAELALQGRGHLDLLKQQYRIEDAVLNIAAKGGQAGDKGVEGVLKTIFHADLKSQSASLNPLRIEGIGMQLDGHIEVEQLQESPRIKGTLKIPPFSPRKTLSALNLPIPETIPRNVLQAGALVADFEASLQGFALPRVLIALDENQIKAKLRVEDFAKPSIVFLLDANTIDVDRYRALLGKMHSDEGQSQGVADVAIEDTIELPVEILRKLSVKGMLEVDALMLGGMRMKKTTATFFGNNGVIQVKPLSLAMYQGQLRSSLKLDVRDAAPAYQLYARAVDIRLGELLKDAVGEESAYIEGTSTLKMKLSTEGDRPSMLKRRLQGDIDLKIEQGKLHDKKFAEKLEALAAFVEKRAAREPDEVVVFDYLGSSWKAEQGVMRNDDLRLNTLLLNFRGEGEIKLPDEHIAYALYPVISGERKDLLLAPITIEGTLSDPEYGLDLTHFARDRLHRSTTRLGEGLKEQTERLGSGVKEFTGNIRDQLDSGIESIKGMFKRDE